MTAENRRARAGMATMAVGMLAAPLVDVIAKLLTDRYSPGQIGLARFGLQTVFLAGLMLAWGARLSRPTVLHGLAGLTIALTILLFVWSLKYLSIATAIAIFFLEPLLLLVLSYLALGEGLDRQRIAAVLVGFGGALLVIRPNCEVFGWVAILPLASAGCYAIHVVLTKSMVDGQNRVALQFWVSGAASVVFALGTTIGSFVGEPLLAIPDAAGWAHFVAMGAVSAIVHLTITTALSLARASVLAPLQYLEIIGAVLLGFIVFGTLPDATMWLGTIIIVATGLFAIRRERSAAAGGSRLG
jgi:drug/metabolite transporter (DMT)-like permease